MEDYKDDDASISNVVDELHHILDAKVEPASDEDEGVMKVLNEIEDIIDNEKFKKTDECKEENDVFDNIFPSKSKDSQGHCKPRKIQCKFCEYKAISNRGLKKHTTAKHKDQKERLVKCKVCVSKFAEDEIYGHYFRSHGKLIEEEKIDTFIDQTKQRTDIDYKSKCQFCKYRCKTDISLKSHLRRKHKESYVGEASCDFCDYSSTKGAVKIHKYRSHRDLVKHYMEQRVKKIKLKKINNDQVDSISKPYPCAGCDFSTTTKSSLTRHRNASHAEIDKEHICRICVFETNSTPAFLKHFNENHEGTKAFSCSECDYTTNVKSQLSDLNI